MVFPVSLMMVNWLGKALMIISAVPKSVATCFLLCICYYANDSIYVSHDNMVPECIYSCMV